ncbi:MAG: choice-of-anchor D domain-containing protein [Deltaproteobacteria bacterium]|nr:choice-of-anchor D domain-containing protein [Deltaproteobacteria bacterium]
MAGSDQPSLGGSEAGGSGGAGNTSIDLGDSASAEYVPAMTTCSEDLLKTISGFKISAIDSNFGDVSVFGSKDIEFKVENVGSVAGERPSVEIVTGSRLGYSVPFRNTIQSECPNLIQPASSCTHSISFAPKSQGVAGGVLRFTSVDGASVDFELCGVGIEPYQLELVTDRKRVDMGMYNVPSMMQGFQLSTPRKAGAAPNSGRLTFDVTGPISIDRSCEKDIDPGTSGCWVKVYANPENFGPFEGAVRVTAERASPVEVSVVGHALLKPSL